MIFFYQTECLTHEQYSSSSSTVKCKNLQFPLDSPIERLWHPLTLQYRVMVQKTWFRLMSMSQVQASHLPDVSRSIKCGVEAGLHVSPGTLVLSFFLGPAQDSIWIFCTFFLHQIIGEWGDLQVSNVGKFNEHLSNAPESKVPILWNPCKVVRNFLFESGQTHGHNNTFWEISL